MDNTVGWQHLGPANGTASNLISPKHIAMHELPHEVLANIAAYLPIDNIQRLAQALNTGDVSASKARDGMISYLGVAEAPIAREALSTMHKADNQLMPLAQAQYLRMLSTLHDDDATQVRKQSVKVDLRNPQYFYEAANQALLIRKQRGHVPVQLLARLVQAWPPIGSASDVKVGTRLLSRAIR